MARHIIRPRNAPSARPVARFHSRPHARSPQYSVLAAPAPSTSASQIGSITAQSWPGRQYARATGRILAGSAVVGVSLVGLFALAPNPGPAPEASSSLLTDAESDPLDALLPSAFANTLRHLEGHSNLDLIRSWVTYLLCESPMLVEHGPGLLDRFQEMAAKVPVVGPAAWSVVAWFARQTLFHQYTAGETCDECLPTMHSLHEKGIGVLFAYSVEAHADPRATSQACHVSTRHIEAMRNAVAVASHFGLSYEAAAPSALKPTSVAVKFSGLVSDPDIYRRAADAMQVAGTTPWDDPEGELFPMARDGRPGLAEADVKAMQELTEELSGLCAMARERGVRLVVDAEYSWFQPAIDRVTQVLSSRFNRPDPHTSSPTVYHTFQAYLRSTPARLRACLDAADGEGFSTGIKLVRGAYLAGEPAYHRAQGRTGLPPTWSTKVETDVCYDTLAAELVDRIAKDLKDPEPAGDSPRVALMIAGHNATSIKKVLERLRDQDGLAENRGTCLAMADELRGRLTFGQILGMADNLTTTLLHLLTTRRDQGFRAGEDSPFVLKYVPFGSVGEVLPYLGRRAQENSAILQDDSGRGGAKDERLAVGREVRRRFKALLFDH